MEAGGRQGGDKVKTKGDMGERMCREGREKGREEQRQGETWETRGKQGR